MTLCETHHWQHHNEGLKLPQQKTRFYTFAAHVQQGKYYLQDQLRQIAPVQTTFGYITAHWRKKQNIRKSHCNDAVVIAQLNVAPDQHLIKSTCIQLRKRSLHEATARKGRKQPNITQKRNNKNVFQVKTFKKWDCVSLSGKIGFISGFTGTSAYIVDIDGSYIRQPKKSYKQVTLSKLKKLHANQDRISQLCLA
jgi:N6-L-threonylcarbamoyladenine synthase